MYLSVLATARFNRRLERECQRLLTYRRIEQFEAPNKTARRRPFFFLTPRI
jgi:hypothetical protein